MSGSFRLFRIWGIDVYLHWTWLLAAGYLISTRQGAYTSPWWNVLEYLTLFGIVLLHEFGHALACRQVGGRAEHILLWPLGGIAYVSPPPRPGPILWSLAAGPLVNLVLVPVLFGVTFVLASTGMLRNQPDLATYLVLTQYLNGLLLIFNLLPVYPLDGGQILRSLLWFKLGPRRSLLIASGIGLVGAAALVLYAVTRTPMRIWTVLIAAYLGLNCWNAFQYARKARDADEVPPVASEDERPPV